MLYVDPLTDHWHGRKILWGLVRKSYQNFTKTKEWKQISSEITEYRGNCAFCGKTEVLQFHHHEYGGENGTGRGAVLCKGCHYLIRRGRLHFREHQGNYWVSKMISPISIWKEDGKLVWHMQKCPECGGFYKRNEDECWNCAEKAFDEDVYITCELCGKEYHEFDCYCVHCDLAEYFPYSKAYDPQEYQQWVDSLPNEDEVEELTDPECDDKTAKEILQGLL